VSTRRLNNGQCKTCQDLAHVTTTRPVGRPRRDPPPYRVPTWRESPPEDLALQLERLASQHMSVARIAVEIGCATATLRRWLAEDPVLQECVTRGRARAEHELYMLIVEAARNGEKLNMPAVYALNNRHGWRIEQQGEGGPRINITQTITLPGPMSREEFMRTVVAEGADARSD
jgi:hypothetical protein